MTKWETDKVRGLSVGIGLMLAIILVDVGVIWLAVTRSLHRDVHRWPGRIVQPGSVGGDWLLAVRVGPFGICPRPQRAGHPLGAGGADCPY